ncbi:MAG: heavy metal translocating P-type ATPase [Brevinema sp.]
MSDRSSIFQVSGMSCTSCAARLEASLSKVNGVSSCSVNFASGSLVINFDSSKLSTKDIIESGKKAGFTLSEERDEILENKEMLLDLGKMIFAWVITLVLGLHMFIPHFHFPLLPKIILSSLVLYFSGYNIFKTAIVSLKNGIMGMDVLIALGAFTAWSSIFFPLFGVKISDYTMTAAMLIAVNLTGRFIEDAARGRASASVLALSNFGAKTADKVLENNEIEVIPVAQLAIGDIIRIKAGEKIPTDGIIIKGHTSTDESFLTGESLPVEKKIGDYVYGASINVSGVIQIRVEKDTTNNLLAQTIKLVQEAQGTKVPIQILADNITKIFVPIILTISFLSFAIWFAFPDSIPSFLNFFNIDFQNGDRLSDAISAAIAVLVIACPCALGLATPMALVTGSSLGAKKGILLRKGAAVQSLNDIQVVALDKTGTLTEGKPKLIAMTSEGISETEALELLSGLEESSTHPLAATVMNYAKEKQVQMRSFAHIKDIPGQGIEGHLEDTDWFCGSLKATKELGINIPAQLESYIHESQEKGETLICLSDLSRKETKAVFSFFDSIKPEAIDVIKQLKQMGKRIIMITGDHKNAAINIGNQLNLNSVISEASPKQKLDNINSLKEQGYKVAFVGDGINDVAALEAADVGIAIGTGTDIANAAGDIVLVSGSLSALLTSFKLAFHTFAKIKQNLFWAFAYNVVAIPMAFTGLLHPIVAEIAMTFSSLTVIVNSLLLSRKKI